jgi:serine protease Do
MTLRRFSRWTAGTGMVLVLFLAAAPNRAADPTPDTKWETARATQPEDVAELKALQERVKTVVDKCSPSTVGILIGFGAGSGVIVSEDGLVLTAAHVITGEDAGGKAPAYEAGKECRIVLPDGTRVKAKTLGVNSDADSGMVQITDKGPNDGKWPAAPIAKSADLKKGQWVVSLGHPGGPKEGRPPVARLGRIENVTKDIVRSNCTLVGGDSGGPLFDLDGKVIGIHSRIGLSLAQNIHVPTELFKNQWDKLVAGEVFGKVGKKQAPGPFLGVVFPEDEDEDAWVTEDVDPETPAGKAGLKAGDTITKFDGTPVKSVKRFRELMKDKKPADTVKLTVRRGTTMHTLSVTLGKRG